MIATMTRNHGAQRIVVDLFVSLAFVVLLLGAGELALRWFGPQPDEGYVHEKLPDSPRLYRPKPGAVGTAGGDEFRINSLGMRDKEYAVEKPPASRASRSSAIRSRSETAFRRRRRSRRCSRPR